MNYRLFLVSFFIFSFVAVSQAQSKFGIKGHYERDTLTGRNFGDFIKPKKTVYNYSFSEVDIVPAFVNECKGLDRKVEMEVCFGDVFFETLRRKMKIPNGLKKNKPIEVLAKFTINELGIMDNFIFLQNNDYTGKVERIITKVLNKMPRISPAMINNQFMKVTYRFPIKIEL